MPGRGRSEGKQSSSNVFKGPPEDGTTSASRAERWQGASPKSDDKDPPKEKREKSEAAAADDADDAKSVASGRSGKSARSSRSATSSKRSGKSKREKGPKGQKMPTQMDWFGDPLKPGIEASLGEGGQLHSFVKNATTRPGMCNPPGNEEVRKALLIDLHAYGVQPIYESRRKKEEEQKKKKKAADAIRKRILVPVKCASPDEKAGAQEPGTLPDGGWGNASTQSLPAPASHGGFGMSSMTSSRMSSPLLSRSMRGSASFTKSKQRRTHESAFLLDDSFLQASNPKKKPGLDTAPEGEVKWRHNLLRKRCREHGFIIEKHDVGDLGELAKYHNPYSRGPLQHPPPPVNPVPASRQVRGISCELDRTTHSIEHISDEVAAGLIPPKPVFRLGPTQEEPSIERLMEMSHHAIHASPHHLERMCRSAQVSVHHGGKLPQGDWEEDDGDLFSGRGGGTPRTRTGKPLPMLKWGKSGGRPKLMAPKCDG